MKQAPAPPEATGTGPTASSIFQNDKLGDKIDNTWISMVLYTWNGCG